MLAAFTNADLIIFVKIAGDGIGHRANDQGAAVGERIKLAWFKSRNRFTGILTKGLVNPCAVDCLSHFSKYSANVSHFCEAGFSSATANHGNKRGANSTRPARGTAKRLSESAPSRARWGACSVVL